MYTIEDFNKRDINNQKSLTDALAFASYKYYVENNPPMSDYQFDMEYKQLQNLEKTSGIVLPSSPTSRVGSDIQGQFRKAKHLIPMQSIENVYSDEELKDWLFEIFSKLKNAFPNDKITFTYEPKYDGVSISLIYKNGILEDAVTRGNQIEGESVIENVKTIRNVPLILDKKEYPELPEYFEVRGEILMGQGAFERVNLERTKSGEQPFANKRNAASGSLKQLDPKVTSKRGLLVNAFAAYSTNETFQKEVLSSQTRTLAYLKKLGFSFYNTERAYSNPEELTKAIEAFNEIRTSHTLVYDCDGVVVKVNERRHQEYLGLNTTFPNWCKARKFPQEARSTQIEDVIFQIGMTGHITPVAVLTPTTIGGTVVSRATLNNEAYIRSLNLSIGSYVFVQRAGEVIPCVTSVDTLRTKDENPELKAITFPKKCPSCGHELIRKGEFFICPNHNCTEQVIQRLDYWCGKNCADIGGLSKNVLTDLVNRLNIRSVNDLYQKLIPPQKDDNILNNTRDKILFELGDDYKTKTKTLAMLFNGLKESIQKLTLDRIIAGLAIDGVGKVTGKVLAAHFGSLEKLKNATLEELLSIENIGDVTAGNIVSFFKPKEISGFADDLFSFAEAQKNATESHIGEYACLFMEEYGFKTTYEEIQKLSDTLNGTTIIFTGTSFRFKRDEIKDFFIRNGAKYVDSVSSKVNYIIIGDKPGQNKIDKGRRLGIEIIPEQDFYSRFGL